MKKIFFVAFLLLFAASITIVEAQPRGMAPGTERMAGRKAALWSDLNLTEEQSEEISALRASLQEGMAPLRMEMVRKRLEMKLLWMAEDPDSVKIKAKQKEIQDLRGKLGEKMIDFRLAVRNILTPEQRSQLLAKRFSRARQRGWDREPRSYQRKGPERGW